MKSWGSTSPGLQHQGKPLGSRAGIVSGKGKQHLQRPRGRRENGTFKETKEVPDRQGSEGEGNLVISEVGKVSRNTQSDKQQPKGH